MDWLIYLILILVGILVGFINTLAGGGSVLSLPLLIFLGLPADVANGTNRIGILLQSFMATASFRQHKIITLKEGFRFSFPAIIGAIIGAFFASMINVSSMEIIIGALLVLMIPTVFINPSHFLKGKKFVGKPSLIQIVIFFIIGFYGGFIQLGNGFFLIIAFVLSSGIDLIKANALKVFVILFYTAFAIPVFIYNGEVNFIYGIILGLGNLLGAWIATKAAIKWGEKFIRYVIAFAIIVSALKLFGAF